MTSIRTVGSAYCDFVFGSSAGAMAESITRYAKNGNCFRYGLPEGIYRGAVQGAKDSYNFTKTNGGFFTSMWKNLQAVPKEWSKAKVVGASGSKNFFRQSFGALKALGKAAPALFAIYGFATELPNLYRATRYGGVMCGLKEFGKTMTKLTFGALVGAFGGMLLPVIGNTYGFALGNAIGEEVGNYVGGEIGEFLSGKAMGGTYTTNHKDDNENRVPNESANFQNNNLNLQD